LDGCAGLQTDPHLIGLLHFDLTGHLRYNTLPIAVVYSITVGCCCSGWTDAYAYYPIYICDLRCLYYHATGAGVYLPSYLTPPHYPRLPLILLLPDIAGWDYVVAVLHVTLLLHTFGCLPTFTPFYDITIPLYVVIYSPVGSPVTFVYVPLPHIIPVRYFVGSFPIVAFTDCWFSVGCCVPHQFLLYMTAVVSSHGDSFTFAALHELHLLIILTFTPKPYCTACHPTPF